VHAYSKALASSGSSAVTPVVANETSEVRVLLAFIGEVHGELVDPMALGAGVGGSHVTLRAFDYETRTTTEERGAFTFDGVREGSFELSARQPDSNRWARATGAISQLEEPPFIQLMLELTETLHVQVDLPADDGTSSGVPAPAIAIDVTQAGITRSIQGENPVEIPGLLLDHKYSIVARELGGEQRSVSFSGKFPTGNATAPIRLVFPAFGSVRVVVAQAGAPAAGARVRATGGSTFEAFTDASGVAVLSGLRLGSVSVQATSLDGNFSDSTTVVLGSQSISAEVALTLGAYAGVAGFVEAESGGPSIGTRVAAIFSSRSLDVLTDTDGRFRFQGIPTSAEGTQVALTYIGPDDVTAGARQTVVVPASAASSVVEVPPVRHDATAPRILSLPPADGATEVSPDSSIVVVFSEPIRADQLQNGLMKLIPADSSASLSTIFSSSTNADGSFAVTMTPPAPLPGQQFRLASNTLYRIFISADLQDVTGNRVGLDRGASFITSDYAEPRVIRTEPAATLPLQANASIRFIFNEPIDTAAFSSGTSTLTASRLSGPGGTVTEPKAGSVFFDPAAPAAILFAPTEPFAGESFYRFVVHGARDLQGNVAADQAFDFFTFDATPPYVTLVSPLPAGESLVSGVEYTIVPEIRNGSAVGSAATDVEKVDWSRVEGSADVFVDRSTASPWSYRFVAPEAPAEGMTL
ncbi:MAG: Ig-like domain-containing protein, partial [Thermoanaerobaculia bacterium]